MKLKSIPLNCFNIYNIIISKCFSAIISYSFGSFGTKSVINLPVRLIGTDNVYIKDNVYIGSGSWLQTISNNDYPSPCIRIDSGVSIAGGCVLSAAFDISIEPFVLMARNVYISDHSHNFSDISIPIIKQGIDRVAPVRIKTGAWLGQNVVVLPGVTIGRNAIIGANSVVNCDVPDFHVAAGNPARILRSIV